MKHKINNLLYLLIITSVALTSCSNNRNDTGSPTSILVKKIIITHSPNDIETLIYKYDGNKIISKSSDGGFVCNYTYTGNVITKIQETVNNAFQNSSEYTYVDGKVATAILMQNYGGTDTYSYTYNTNGSISYKRTRTGSQNTTGLLTITNGNIIKNEEFYGGQYPSTSTYTFSYDTKNNPFKNVLGFNLLLDPDTDIFSPNNMTIDGSGGSGNLRNYTFKYDTNNFPIERKYSNGNSTESYKYFY